MFYKIVANNRILDALMILNYVKYQPKNGAIVRCSKEQANGVLSSDGSKTWAITGWGGIPLSYVQPAMLIEIDDAEYSQLKEMLAEEKQVIIEEKTSSNESNIGEMTLETLIEYKIKKMSEECQAQIVKGFDIILSNGEQEHFDLTFEDQINLLSLQSLLDKGYQTVPYHAKGKPCEIFSKEDIQAIINKAEQHRLYHLTYFNSLKIFIGSQTNVRAVCDIYYGYRLPLEYQTEAFKQLDK